MRETLLKSIAVLVALGGAGVLVWFAMRDPKAPDAGEVQETLHAPTDGMIFGLRALPNVTVGDWCCFFAEIQGTLP